MLSSSDDHYALLSFPTRRSSDLESHIGDLHPLHLARGRLCGAVELRLRSFRCSFLLGGLSVYRVDVARRLDVVLWRSEEHTSELQSRGHLVCTLLHEKTKIHHMI